MELYCGTYTTLENALRITMELYNQIIFRFGIHIFFGNYHKWIDA